MNFHISCSSTAATCRFTGEYTDCIFASLWLRHWRNFSQGVTMPPGIMSKNHASGATFYSGKCHLPEYKSALLFRQVRSRMPFAWIQGRPRWPSTAANGLVPQGQLSFSSFFHEILTDFLSPKNLYEVPPCDLDWIWKEIPKSQLAL